MPTADDERIADILHATRRIAVIGASSSAGPAVVRRLPTAARLRATSACRSTRRRVGPRIPAFATLEEAAAATGPFDIVDVFRRADLVVPHAHEAVAIAARCFWLQLGIVNWEAATIAAKPGSRW